MSNRNLRLARNAVRYVKDKMTFGASNRLESYASIPGMPLAPAICVATLRAAELVQDQFRDEYELTANGVPTWLESASGKAESLGCGNCGEQAALAFMYLLLKKQVKPLDYMHRNNVDHAFVVIGRDSGASPSEPERWGNSAVVCDPWNEQAYRAEDIEENMYRSISEQIGLSEQRAISPFSMYRISEPRPA